MPFGRRSQLQALLRFFDATADSEDVSVRMSNVHLANIPGHVGRRPRNLQALFETPLVNGVDVVDPDRHPDALISRVIAAWTERHLNSTSASAALGIQAEKDLTLARTHAAERGRISPVPTLLPAEFL